MGNKYTAQLLMGSLNEEWLNSMNVYPVYMPQAWSVLFYDENETKQYVKRLKLDPLGRHIQSLHPGVISYSLTEDALNGKKPWLYVVDKLKYLEELQELIKDWFLWVDKQTGISDLARLLDFHLIYDSKLSVDEIKDNDKVIEGLLTRYFCQGVRRFEFLETQDRKEREMICDFRTAFSGRRHQAISMPILLKEDYFSFVITFNSTVDPWTKEKRITINPSIRRWQRDTYQKSESLVLDRKKNHSLYVLDKERQGSPFFRFQIKSVRGEGGRYRPAFCFNHEYSFQKLTRKRYNLDELVANPRSFLEMDDFFIAVPYGNSSFGSSHRVGSGIEPQLKKALYNYFMDSFDPIDLTKSFPLQKDEGIQKPNKIFGKKDGRRTVDFHEVDSKGKNEFMSLHVWSDDQVLFDWVLDVINNSFLGFRKLGSDRYMIQTANGKEVFLTVKQESLENMDRKMDNDSDVVKTERVNEILDILDQKKQSKGAYHLIQIPAYEDDKDKTGDPKDVIRKAFALKEMKTQFIHPIKIPNEALTEKKKGEIVNDNYIRIEKSLLDIFSKSGFMGSMTCFKYNLYGFDLLRINDKREDDKVSYLPILSCCTSGKVGYYLLKSKKFIYQDDWLAHIDSIKKEIVTDLNWHEIERNLIGFFNLYKDEHKILTISAGVRRYFEHLRNDHFELKHHLLDYVPTLSLCRYNVGWDVPGFYTYDHSKEETAKTKGMIQLHEHLFFAIGQKPDTDTVGKWDTRFSRKSANFKDRQLAELLIVSNDTDNLLEIANVVNNSRDIHITTNFHGKYDFSLRLLGELKEYMEKI
ncbi:pPIWI_RE module domain-containing protein [Thermoactinomyces sp. DSM 45892]|uniref:pPIWI_RE module domain-containing protein n=1 Tax=Thermoactinomyces sp. DSM 45892 TaxID=1882753 RepID=UPI000897350A|nr:DUF3962 domain-containing protein [Thermoactinomyces sp. DSM 45892]SDX92999.1 protein of unknown function [Thermoactinomyces sp. DSM 45892]